MKGRPLLSTGCVPTRTPPIDGHAAADSRVSEGDLGGGTTTECNDVRNLEAGQLA